jgi:hypothetical protein
VRLKQSLLFRLVVFSFLGSAIMLSSVSLIYVLPMTYFHIWPFSNRSIDSYASTRARSVIIDALRKSNDGVMFIEATDKLAALKANSPRLRYAVIDDATNAYVDGSADELRELAEVEKFAKTLHDFDMRSASFNFKNSEEQPRDVSFSRRHTDFGPVKIAIYGYSFSWEDLLGVIFGIFNYGGFWRYTPIVMGVVAISAVILRGGLAPLRKVSSTPRQRICGRQSRS